MPKIRTKQTKYPPDWEKVRETLEEFERKMRDAIAESHDGKRKVESVWPVMQINHQRSRYVYEMFYKKHAITKQTYEFCLKEGHADKSLIAKWKKPGYERLCCVKCIQSKETTTGSACICRVPKDQLQEGQVVQCTCCGCRGCASGDV
ncbi:putative BUD31 protein [Blattamonas nauphoetae]|uniref:BUD31 protein n=1 Tax=Blattamonas nauphoetae TaxID=2049346 RepID=A0ABQ9YEH7_9EUKA|nr:putative BUD31 protein [Blattamonas nauphoetae]